MSISLTTPASENANLLPLTTLNAICDKVQIDDEGFVTFYGAGLYRIDPETELDDEQRDLYTLVAGGLSELFMIDGDLDVYLEVQLVKELADGTMVVDCCVTY